MHHLDQKNIRTDFENIIRPTGAWFDLKLTELWRYRDLVWFLVKRDLVAVYKQTVLGPFWHIAQALITTLMYAFVFGRLAGLSTDGTPPMLFYMAGVVVWTYFQKCMVATSNTFIAHAQIFEKVYFPRLAIPVSIVISNMISFFIQCALFVLFYAFYVFKGTDIAIKPALLWFPVLLLLISMLSLGLGVIVSAMTTRYRDLKFLVEFGAGLLMYTTPVIYPLSSIPHKYWWIILLNPLSAIIETLKYGLFGAGVFDYRYLGLSAFMTLIILALGVLMFTRVEKNFVDTI